MYIQATTTINQYRHSLSRLRCIRYPKVKKITLILITLLFTHFEIVADEVKQSNIEPWNIVAENALLYINTGNGDKFASLSHHDFKVNMRKTTMAILLDDKYKASLKKELKAYGVESVLELNRLDLNQFISKTIVKMFSSLSEETRKIQLSASFQSSASLQKKNIREVMVKVVLRDEDKVFNDSVLIFVKYDGKSWKYFGDSRSRPKEPKMDNKTK